MTVIVFNLRDLVLIAALLFNAACSAFVIFGTRRYSRALRIEKALLKIRKDRERTP